VCITGEFVDNYGFSVLPAAIEQDFLIAVATNDEDKIEIHNTNPNFKSLTLSNAPDQPF